MKFIERESVRFVLAGGLNTAATYAAYLVLLLYWVRHRIHRDLCRRVRTRMCYPPAGLVLAITLGKGTPPKDVIRCVGSTVPRRARRSHGVSC